MNIITVPKGIGTMVKFNSKTIKVIGKTEVKDSFNFIRNLLFM